MDDEMNGAKTFVMRMQNEDIHVAVASNEGYIIGALVALSSVAVCAQPGTMLHFHIFTENVKRKTFEWVTRTLCRLHSNSVIQEYVCDESLLNGMPSWGGSRMASVRCFMPEILSDVDWCLYLDCDVLYLASLEDFWHLRDDSCYAVAVQDEAQWVRRLEGAWALRHCGVNIPDNEYFNSGVMLLNLRKCRTDKVPKQMSCFFKKHPDVRFPDQTAMNVIFNGKKRMAPARFNRIQGYLSDDKLSGGAVIHYTGGGPWVRKLSTLATVRFRLWHVFADRYVWQKRGASYKYCFGKYTVWIKYLLYFMMKSPLWRLTYCVYAVFGKGQIFLGWRRGQVASDCTEGGVKSILERLDGGSFDDSR